MTVRTCNANRQKRRVYGIYKKHLRQQDKIWVSGKYLDTYCLDAKQSHFEPVSKLPLGIILTLCYWQFDSP